MTVQQIEAFLAGASVVSTIFIYRLNRFGIWTHLIPYMPWVFGLSTSILLGSTEGIKLAIIIFFVVVAMHGAVVYELFKNKE